MLKNYIVTYYLKKKLKLYNKNDIMNCANWILKVHT